MYELNYWAGDSHYVVVMEGTIEQCRNYSRNFCKWNDCECNFLIRDTSDYSKQYYFTAEYELITTAQYIEQLNNKEY